MADVFGTSRDEKIPGRGRFDFGVMLLVQHVIAEPVVFFLPQSIEIPMKNPAALFALLFNEKCYGNALTDIENIFVFSALRRSFFFQAVAM